MNINRIERKTLSDLVAGQLASSILDGTFPVDSQLPPERVLMGSLDVSRSTLREALKILGEINLIEARPGVGWFVRPLGENNVTKAHELAASDNQQDSKPLIKVQPASSEVATGPKRLPTAPDKPLRIPNLKKDRLGTFDFISWWERDKVEEAKVMIVGAGALGNEVIKNLTLMGVGHIYVVDFDEIEMANLSRSILFRESDSGRKKAELAAARAKEINPNVHLQYLHGDITNDIGLGVFRRMDVVIGCLDNREARLAVNRFCNWVNRTWVDGAIQELLGLVRVFTPGDGACFECTLTADARRDLAIRYSCPLLARQNVLMGKVPTTPTIASIIGAMQSQEALKVINGMPVSPGKVVHFNGMVNDMHTTSYVPDELCESHWQYGEISELPARAETTTLGDLLQIARTELGSEAIIELDQELVEALECRVCNTVENVLKPISDISFEAGHCPVCGEMREVHMTHTIDGSEDFLHRTLASIGIPPLHIMRAQNGEEYRFYELTGDLEEALHFRHFEDSPDHPKKVLRERIHIGEEVQLDDIPGSPARGRVKLFD